MPVQPKRGGEAKRRAARVAAMTVTARYPIGLVDLELLVLSASATGVPTEAPEQLRLALEPAQIRQIAEKLEELATALELIGGPKQ